MRNDDKRKKREANDGISFISEKLLRHFRIRLFLADDFVSFFQEKKEMKAIKINESLFKISIHYRLEDELLCCVLCDYLFVFHLNLTFIHDNKS